MIDIFYTQLYIIIYKICPYICNFFPGKFIATARIKVIIATIIRKTYIKQSHRRN